jgi:hypothetical protein
MKAFLSGVAAAILIAIVAAVALEMLGWSSADVYRAPASVRL